MMHRQDMHRSMWNAGDWRLEIVAITRNIELAKANPGTLTVEVWEKRLQDAQGRFAELMGDVTKSAAPKRTTAPENGLAGHSGGQGEVSEIRAGSEWADRPHGWYRMDTELVERNATILRRSVLPETIRAE